MHTNFVLVIISICLYGLYYLFIMETNYFYYSCMSFKVDVKAVESESVDVTVVESESVGGFSF